jgi:hypothetical protein
MAAATKAGTVQIAPWNDVLGIAGLTPGGLGIWVLVGGLVAWWIRGMADRRRASNEGVTAESKASEAQFMRLEREIGRMLGRIEALEKGLAECEHRHAVAEAEVFRLRAMNDARGEIRQRAQEVVAADRANDRATEAKKD